MTQTSEGPAHIPEGWTVLPQIQDRIARERSAAVPEIAYWLVRKYLREVDQSTKPEVLISFTPEPFCTVDFRYFNDPQLRTELCQHLKDRGWWIEFSGSHVYVMPMAEPEEFSSSSSSPSLSPDPAVPQANDAQPAETRLSWWRVLWNAIFYQ